MSLRRFKSSNPGLKPVARTQFFQRIRSRTVRKIGFRTAILQLVLGALLVTVALIGAIGYLNSDRTLRGVTAAVPKPCGRSPPQRLVRSV